MVTDLGAGADAVPAGPREGALIDRVLDEGASPPVLAAFQELVLDHYRAFGRDLPWRHSADPYAILVSEVMLQQTRVERVRGRWERFVDRFPDLEMLAGAPLAEVLSEWQGMGYNRRAVNLKRIAEAVVADHGGVLPRDPDVLRTMPGLGAATAASVSVFAYDNPVAFVETNVRAVYLHIFFSGIEGVKDAQIAPLAEEALWREDPRVWHWALMDYGVALKRALPNPSRRSAHHARQAAFEGSNRQLRGRILRALLAAGPMTAQDVTAAVDGDQRAGDALLALGREGLVEESAGLFSIAD